MPFPKDRVEKMFVLIEKDEIRVSVEGTKSEQGAKFTIDPSTKPKQIDFTKETRDSEWTDRLEYKLFRSGKWAERKPFPPRARSRASTSWTATL